MTKKYLLQKQAKDIKLGDMFVDWAAQIEYQEPRRVLDIKHNDPHYVELVLDSGYRIKTRPDMLLVVEVMA